MNKIDSLKIVLEFYKELGFERLPLNYSQKSDVRRQKPEYRSQNTDVKEAQLNALREEIGDCQRCKLSMGRTHIVFGEGNANAKIMFIGEGPGREEDLQARPFVGDAGQLLTRLIERMGFKREDVYIANIVKCRPPMNRDPQDDEISACFPFLDKQIDIISPEVIVSLGKISAYMLMGVKGPISKFSITKVRGRFYEYKGIPVMPTFHPAYLLRNPKDKWLTWEDAQAVLKRLRQAGEE
jgi:uracil-DNA glycosylase family 4